MRHALAELAGHEPPHAQRFQQPINAVERAALKVPTRHAVRLPAGQKGFDVGVRSGIIQPYDAEVAAGERNQVAVAANVFEGAGQKHTPGRGASGAPKLLFPG